MAKRHSALNAKQHTGELPLAVLDAGAIREEVEKLAHQYWLDRGCPIWTPNEDWFRAEKEIRAKRSCSVAG